MDKTCTAGEIIGSFYGFKRKNGFVKPYHLLQLITWAVYTFLILCFYLIYLPSLNFVLKIVISTLVGALFILVFIAAFFATIIDPIDHNISPNNVKDKGNAEGDHKKTLCDECGWVEESSKHCRVCNKCVEDFDHHCVWLNNCVGDANYKIFLWLLISLAFLTLVFISISIYLIVEQSSSNSIYINWLNYYGWWSSGLFYTFIIITLVLNIIVLIFVSELLFFHIYLICNNLTTYLYIRYRINETVSVEETEHPKVKKTCSEVFIINKKKLKKSREKRKDNEKEEQDNKDTEEIEKIEI